MNQKLLKLDIHLNLGDIPTTKRLTKLIETPEDMIKYILKYSLTHALILYRDIEEYREVRNALPPDIVLYPLKWIVNIDVELPQLQNEPEAVGVCVHSHRGTVDGKEFGLDYSGRPIHKIFKALPENFIVCVHTQGVNSYRNISKGLSVAKWAVKYPHLKFLIEHTGSYVRKEFYPKMESINDFHEGHRAAFLQDAVGSENCVAEAILVSERLHNVFNDTSIITTVGYKSDRLDKTNRWAFGSDYPFELDLNPVDKQINLFKKHYGYTEEDIQGIHQRGINFLEADWKDLFYSHYNIEKP